MAPLLDHMISKVSSIMEIENPEVRETVGFMVATLRGFDILTFTNIRGEEDRRLHCCQFSSNCTSANTHLRSRQFTEGPSSARWRYAFNRTVGV